MPSGYEDATMLDSNLLMYLLNSSGESLAVAGLLTEPRWLGQETGHSHPGLLRGYRPSSFGCMPGVH